MVYHEKQRDPVNETFLSHLSQDLFDLWANAPPLSNETTDEQMNKLRKKSEQQSVKLTWFEIENTLRINVNFYNYHFSMNGNWFIVSPIIVSMVTGLKLKNAISQLLIELETCIFFVFAFTFRVVHDTMRWKPDKNRHNPSTPTVNSHLVPNAHLLPTVYLVACPLVDLPGIVLEFAKSPSYL